MAKSGSQSSGVGVIFVLLMGAVILWALYGRSQGAPFHQRLNHFIESLQKDRAPEQPETGPQDILESRDREELNSLIEEVTK